MPVYEYKCHKCGEVFEMMRNLKDADKPVFCPQCVGTPAMQKLISKSSVQFKGNGWAKDLYHKKAQIKR